MAFVDRLEGVFQIGVPGLQHAHGIRAGFLVAAQQVDAVQSRHLEIRDHHGKRAGFDGQTQARQGVVTSNNMEFPAEIAPYRTQQKGIVIDKEDGEGSLGRGHGDPVVDRTGISGPGGAGPVPSGPIRRVCAR